MVQLNVYHSTLEGNMRNPIYGTLHLSLRIIPPAEHHKVQREKTLTIYTNPNCSREEAVKLGAEMHMLNPIIVRGGVARITWTPHAETLDSEVYERSHL